MCIIVVKPEDVSLSIDTIVNMWVHNPDGAGFMYQDGGKLKIVKGLMKIADFYKEYSKVAERKLVIHFRWRTHGEVSKNLTHPFQIDRKTGMVHNGVIPINTPSGESDTSWFASRLQNSGQNIMEALERRKVRQRMVNKIGLSKLVFMNNAGNVQILNGHMGHFSDDGCWYSNNSYKSGDEYLKLIAEDYNPKAWTRSSDLIRM
jgi:predicted glutamine amidotransferase